MLKMELSWFSSILLTLPCGTKNAWRHGEGGKKLKEVKKRHGEGWRCFSFMELISCLCCLPGLGVCCVRIA